MLNYTVQYYILKAKPLQFLYQAESWFVRTTKKVKQGHKQLLINLHHMWTSVSTNIQSHQHTDWRRKTTNLEGSWCDKRDVIMVQREWLERWKGAKGPFWQELESVLFQVDGRGLAGKLFGQISQACSVTQNTATPLLCAGAGWRTGPYTSPTGHDPLRQQPQHRRWKDQISKYQWTEDSIYLQLSVTFPC